MYVFYSLHVHLFFFILLEYELVRLFGLAMQWSIWSFRILKWLIIDISIYWVGQFKRRKEDVFNWGNRWNILQIHCLCVATKPRVHLVRSHSPGVTTVARLSLASWSCLWLVFQFWCLVQFVTRLDHEAFYNQQFGSSCPSTKLQWRTYVFHNISFNNLLCAC